MMIVLILIAPFLLSITQNLFLTSHSLPEKCPNAEFFLVPYFSAFGLNKEKYGVSFCIQFKYGKIRTRKTSSVFGHFSRSGYQQETIKICQNLLAKGFIDKFIGMNIKQKVKIRQMSIDNFLNQTLWEWVNFFYCLSKRKW